MRYSYNQCAFELLDLYRAKITKTDDVDLRELKKWIRLQRSVWLRNEYNKNREIDDACEQDLGAVQMDMMDGTFLNVPGTGITTPVLISRLEIPTTVELYDRPALTRIGPVSKLNYNYLPVVNLTRLPFVGNGRFNMNSIYPFQWNNHIGIICKGTNINFTDILTNGLNVVGIFEDITAAARYPEHGDTVGLTAGFSTIKYFDDDSEAPIHDWMLYYMREQLIKLEGNISYQVTEKEEQKNGKE
jgi:hypothetical protein